MIDGFLEQLTFTYLQEEDRCGRQDVNNQWLRLEAMDSPDTGYTYYVMSTERWAFDNIDELTSTLQDFINKANKLKQT